MAADDVLDDGQAQTGAAPFPAALDVHPVESLGQAGNGVGGRCPRHRRGPRRKPGPPALARSRPRTSPLFAAILDGIVNQVLEQLHQFVMIADHLRQTGLRLAPSR